MTPHVRCEKARRVRLLGKIDTMAEFIPLGRLSSHDHAGKTIQIQTEFATRPQPRVTTSVVLDGRIVHKADSPWEQGIESEEDRKNLEKFLSDQHHKVRDMVRAQAEEIVGKTAQTTESPEFPDSSFRDSMVEVLGSLPSVTGVYEFDEQGKTIFSHNYQEIFAEWDREFKMLTRLVDKLPDIIRVGEFRHGCCWFQSENVIILNIQGRRFGIMTDPSGSSDELRKEFPELFEAVYA